MQCLCASCDNDIIVNFKELIIWLQKIKIHVWNYWSFKWHKRDAYKNCCEKYMLYMCIYTCTYSSIKKNDWIEERLSANKILWY